MKFSAVLDASRDVADAWVQAEAEPRLVVDEDVTV